MHAIIDFGENAEVKIVARLHQDKRFNLVNNLVISLVEANIISVSTRGSLSTPPQVDINLRKVVSYPHILRAVSRLYVSKLRSLQFDCLAAYPYAGLPIGVGISLEMNRPLIYPRKGGRSFQYEKEIEGVFYIGQRAVLIEDQITTGHSITEALSILKAAGLIVNESVVLFDHEEGGMELLQESGVRIHSILSMTELLAFLELHDRISSHQRIDMLAAMGIA